MSEEVLSTVMAEVTAMLNARPLTHLSVDPEDESPLTPNHFLLGRKHPHIPPDVFTESVGELSRRRWTAAQELAERYWKRWLVEYVPALTEREKWYREGKRDLAVGDLVLIVDPSSPRGYWPTGRVTELLVSKAKKDKGKSVVRVVKVRTQTGEFKRPVVKLCLLRKTEEEDTSSN